MPKKFLKNVEDFVCEKCGFDVKGSGYTNHCPKCLYSKHVDNNPGDRGSDCGGLMKPYKIEGSTKGNSKNSDMSIVYKCQKCGLEKRNHVSDLDDMTKIFEIQTEYSKNCL